MRHRVAALLLVAACVGTTARGARPACAAEPRPLPISAHNCYPAEGGSPERLAEALRLGIDNIEIDLGWDAEGRRLIVGHDPQPRPGASYAEFEAYLFPALKEHFRTPRADGAPTVLTVDWKTREPDAVERFHAILEAHPEWFSSAAKAEKAALTTRRLIVCLTGEDDAKDRYDALVPAGGEYRAFRDTVYNAGRPYRSEINAYAPEPATVYRRFLTIYWGHVERGGPALAGDWTEQDDARLRALVSRAHSQGYRVRFYTLNGQAGRLGDGYRFPDLSAARLRWVAAMHAAADWVASDDYVEIVRALGAER
jgi:hypothetical protein